MIMIMVMIVVAVRRFYVVAADIWATDVQFVVGFLQIDSIMVVVIAFDITGCRCNCTVDCGVQFSHATAMPRRIHNGFGSGCCC